MLFVSDRQSVDNCIMEVHGSTCQSATVGLTKRAVTSKKRSRCIDVLTDFVEEIGKFVTAYQEAMKEIKGIASFFKKEAEGIDRRMMLFTEIMQLEGFSPQEMLAGDYIIKDAYKIDFFFTLP
ncbi:hypothetical protein CRYUN_Cryun17cG0063900 [Craigia yunnanensis]